VKRWWAAYVSKFETMSRRERLLIGAAAILVPAAIIFVVFVDPALMAQHTMRNRIEKQRAELVALENATAGGPAAAPDAGYREREGRLRKELGAADETLKALYKTLVPANRAAALLRQMLAEERALELVSLRTLPPRPLIGAADEAPPGLSAKGEDAAAATGGAGVYKHAVEITLRGDYNALYAYLARLERSSWAVYWWRAQLTTDERSALTLTVTVNTLSLDKAWLEL
jgi:MSHA biogenesis protein MshJ